jgi:thiamine biosynthesis lipoprotein
MKNIALALALLFSMAACKTEKKAEYLAIEGETMGTYYKVTYLDSLSRDFKKPVDSLLEVINNEISTYVPTSTISKFNQADSTFELGLLFAAYAECVNDVRNCGATVKNRHFYANYLAAKAANYVTRKAFDATVMPLVNYWGFGYTPHKAVEKTDSLKVDSLIRFVGMEKVTILDKSGYAVIRKSEPGVQLDFGGTGQGYAIDIIAELLEMNGIKNYLVDIGGECRARGKNPKGQWWTIGINTPRPEADIMEFTQTVQLENMSVSTSGNYRNFYEVDGGKYSHFINPATGFPQRSNLLSASVFGRNCLEPDALATGFMVLGLEEAFELAMQLQPQGIEALFIYSDEKGNLQIKYTPGVEKMLIKEQQH